MFDVVLVAPEIATNTGNIIRLCANTGGRLHLVEPLGFRMDDASLRRAGLDYHDLTSVTIHPDLTACDAALALRRRFTCSSHASVRLDQAVFAPGDVFVFGAERAGLTPEQVAAFEPTVGLRIPMRPGNRSLNLANAVAVVVYEAWRQHGFDGAAERGATTAETLLTREFDC
jgi:tRNA (cytidine/uridine-2'-O-)-methyltransferase